VLMRQLLLQPCAACRPNVHIDGALYAATLNAIFEFLTAVLLTGVVMSCRFVLITDFLKNRVDVVFGVKPYKKMWAVCF
jgi:hypothetical protein